MATELVRHFYDLCLLTESVVAGFPNPFPDTPVSLFVPLCVCLFGHLRVRLYRCMRMCVRAALLVARCAASAALHLCGCFALYLSAQVRKTMNDC